MKTRMKLAYFGLGGLFVAIGYLLAIGVGGIGTQVEMWYVDDIVGWGGLLFILGCALSTNNGSKTETSPVDKIVCRELQVVAELGNLAIRLWVGEDGRNDRRTRERWEK